MTDAEALEVATAIQPGVQVSRRPCGGWRLSLGSHLALVSGAGASEAALRRALEDGAHALRLMALGREQGATERDWRADIERRVEALEVRSGQEGTK